MLPRTIVACASGWKLVTERADHFTGKTHAVMAARRQALHGRMEHEHIGAYRRAMMQLANSQLDGQQIVCPPEKLQSHFTRDQICAMKTAPAKGSKYKGREGAKKVKQFERAQLSADGLLDSNAATKYGQVGARGNYLSQDRVDVSYNTKELCRDLSAPIPCWSQTLSL